MAATTLPPSAPVEGRRERKKRETYRALSNAARELAYERGLERLTIESIAEAADVSVRTFFNYFPCKEEAIVGVDPDVLAEVGEQLQARPRKEHPVAALRMVLLGEGDDDVAGAARNWALRNELVRRHPALLPHYLTSVVQVQHALIDAMAARLEMDPKTDLFPTVVVSAVVSVLRSITTWAEESDTDEPVGTTIDRALAILTAGLAVPRRRA
jgi:AcrR family transcriptional regulator